MNIWKDVSQVERKKQKTNVSNEEKEKYVAGVE